MKITMKHWHKKILTGISRIACLFVAITGPGLAYSDSNRQIVSLGTGGVTGLYYPTGGAICRLVNLQRNAHGTRCALRSTPGSVSNLLQVVSGELDLGIAEAGQLNNAYQGQGDFSEPAPGLRTLTGLFPEYISVLVRKDAGINQFSDLREKRFNTGRQGSSQRLTMDILMTSRGWLLDDFSEVLELEPAEQAQALCDNRIDATLYVVGHPSGAIKEAIRDCDSQLIPLMPEDIAALTRQNSHYQPVSIPGALYSTDMPDVKTAGVNAVLFTRSDLPDEVAYNLVRSLFEQFDHFKRMHPAFGLLEAHRMINTPLAAPMHPGAERYFREQGLLARQK